ncbi:uncharacterized protein LOC130695927 [Daphnia carinata]|uniref:uncharacterized protein LOC130695927 n=1 Tax=Daphnia carinata TaxID=120202 RepID=UPI00257CD695|nr:uncharacterized protein LOC130695927 [Daphnia carinata]
MGNNNSVSVGPNEASQTMKTPASNRKMAWQSEDTKAVEHATNMSANAKLQATDAEVPLQEINSLDIFETLYRLPNEIENLKMLQDLSEEILHERQRIIKKLREMADYLAKTHNDVLIADRVGTGVGIGSGLLVIGGLIAAPFTAGISLGLTITGTATGLLGGVTSAGANITGYFISKNELTSLKAELGEHLLHLEKLSTADSKYLVRATRFRPTLEMLGKLSEQGWMQLFGTFQKLITLALNGDYAQINKAVNHVADPQIKHLIQKLPLPLDPELLHALADACSLVITQMRGIKQAIAAFLNYFKRPELAKLAVIYTSSAAAARTTTATAATEIKSVFRGTPMAMTKTARTAAGALTAAFIVIDVIHMVRICYETGETPTVQELRKMANDLEEEIKVPSDDATSEKELHKMANDFQKEMDSTVDASKETMKKNEPCFRPSDVRAKIGVPSTDTGRIEETDDEQFFDCREN